MDDGSLQNHHTIQDERTPESQVEVGVGSELGSENVSKEPRLKVKRQR